MSVRNFFYNNLLKYDALLEFKVNSVLHYFIIWFIDNVENVIKETF